MEFIKSNKWKYEVITLYDGAEPVMSIIPENGAVLSQLKLKNKGKYQPVLWEIGDDELIENPWFKQCILFPYPNRLEDGRYEWQGRQYQFPINEKERNNQLHGFLYNQPFEVDAIDNGLDEATIKLKHHYDGHLAHYPFPFKFSVSYTFSQNTVKVNFEVKNSGSSALPFGIGWHPYFRLKKDGDYAFKAPALEKYGLNERSIPTGQKIPTAGDLEIHYQSLDDVFRIVNEERQYHLIEQTSDLQLTFMCDAGFNFLQLFTPHPGTVAVEPMTCLINAFNNKEGLSVLPPAAVKSLHFSVSLTSSS